MHNMKLFILLFSLLSLSPIFAQEVVWNLNFQTIFDNREGDNKYTDTKTFFQTQLSPEIGLSMMDGKHTVAGGVVWTQPIGSSWDGYKIDPTLYYRFKSPRWKFAMGFVPRRFLIQQLPNFLWSDSMAYSRANIRGLLIQYQRQEGFFETYLDWRGMQSETTREAFSIVAHGEWAPKNGKFLLGGHVMMNHFALQKNPPADQHIVDNFIINPYVGVNLSHSTPLDSLTIKAGMLMGLTRNRALGTWTSPTGVWIDATAEWRWLGLKNTFYSGGKLYPYYNQFGSSLDMGEPYYQSKYYNRTSVYAYVLRNWFMNLEASVDFHVAKDNFTFYQRVLLRFFIDQQGWKARKNSHKGENLRNIY